MGKPKAKTINWGDLAHDEWYLKKQEKLLKKQKPTDSMDLFPLQKAIDDEVRRLTGR